MEPSQDHFEKLNREIKALENVLQEKLHLRDTLYSTQKASAIKQEHIESAVKREEKTKSKSIKTKPSKPKPYTFLNKPKKGDELIILNKYHKDLYLKTAIVIDTGKAQVTIQVKRNGKVVRKFFKNLAPKHE